MNARGLNRSVLGQTFSLWIQIRDLLSEQNRNKNSLQKRHHQRMRKYAGEWSCLLGPEFGGVGGLLSMSV